jgi:hypothetical protein
MRYILIGVHLEREDAEIDGVTLFDVHDLVVSAIAIDEDTSTAAPEVLNRAMEVRRQLLDRQTFIAVRYGTPVRSAEEITERIATRSSQWRELLRRRRGLVEVTLKVAPVVKADRPDRATVASGTEYLTKLHDMRKATLDDATRAAVASEFEFAAESKWIARQDGGSELVSLVSREALARVREAGENLQRKLPDLAFLLSGPWPLEVFGDE